jgi:hypothetical protein
MERYKTKSSRFPRTDNVLAGCITTMQTVVWSALALFLIYWAARQNIGCAIIAILLLIITLSLVIRSSLVRWRAFWHLRPYKALLTRLDGEAEEVLLELQDHDESLEKEVIRALAHGKLHHWKEAETHARAGLAIVQHTTPDRSPVGKWAHAHLITAFWTALFRQGRYKEASLFMRDRIGRALLPNQLRVLTAWGFFLADDERNSQFMLAQVVPMHNKRQPIRIGLFSVSFTDDYQASEELTGSNRESFIAPEYQVLLLYLLHRIQGQPIRDALLEYHHEIDIWAGYAAQNADNVYGERLQALVEDLRAITKGKKPYV